MKTVFTALPALILAAPAFAHGGMHLHPHGIDSATLLVLGSLAVAAAAAVYAKVRK